MNEKKQNQQSKSNSDDSRRDPVKAGKENIATSVKDAHASGDGALRRSDESLLKNRKDEKDSY